MYTLFVNEFSVAKRDESDLRSPLSVETKETLTLFITLTLLAVATRNE